ncbi:MAG: hypothetical protein QXL91_05525 [Candidatus Bathyarchaeia archaeon]|uniref:hypothetical protein n=1 Tax=Thermofilum sp. TaxID=1961369 RepID=UPI00317E54B6
MKPVEKIGKHARVKAVCDDKLCWLYIAPPWDNNYLHSYVVFFETKQAKKTIRELRRLILEVYKELARA